MQLKNIGLFFRTKKNAMFCALVAVMMLSAGFTMNGLPKNIQRVSVHVDGETITDMTVQTEPHDIFEKLGVSLGEKDAYDVFQSADRRSTEIFVRRAVPVRISFWDDTQEVLTSGRTVGEVMAEYGYDPDEVDVEPEADTPITENLAIQLTESEQTMEQCLACEREEYEGYEEDEGYEWNEGDEGYEERAAYEVSRGIPRYRDVYTMYASAYLPSDGGGNGITATGMLAQHGVVAVDPNVIPLGTRLYIPGYGEAIAADTGGAIIGDAIDLCMESYDEAIQFGRRYVEVYVID